MKSTSSRLQAKITKLYMDMRLKRISRLNWMIETEKAIEALRQLEHTDIVPELFYAQLLLTKGAVQEAEETLEQCARWLRVYSQSAPACHAYYLYLTTLSGEDAAYDLRVTEKLRELARRHSSIWQIQWLLYYVDKELAESALEQYHFLKGMFIKGCRSPLMYLEARALLERNPTFLYEFSEFEVQLVVFMIRRAGMSERVGSLLSEYMLRRTDYRYLYLIILYGCYERTPSRAWLESICKMLVSGGCTGAKASLWYRKGILDNVRVPGLFEAFLKSLPIEEWYMDGMELSDARKIPSEALTYFAHAYPVDEVRTAYLYALVHKYRDNWFSTYRLYEPLLQPFMLDALAKGHLNAGLAYLYENILEPSKLPAECVQLFVDICHSYRITGLPTESGTLQIRYAHSKSVLETTFAKGQVIVPLYGQDMELLAYQYSGQQMPVEELQKTPMFTGKLWRDFMEPEEVENIYFHMALVEEALAGETLPDAADSVKKILASDEILHSFKEQAAEEMLPYWDVNGVYEEILAAVPYVFDTDGCYDKEAETLFWREQYRKNRLGIYGMRFLLEHYQGSLQEESSIFARAFAMGLETVEYGARLLTRMMEEKQLLLQHVDIFEQYQKHEDASEELVRAYLEFVCGWYFFKEKLLEDVFLQAQAELACKGVEFSVIARLCYLQSVASGGMGTLSESRSETAVSYIKKLQAQNIYLSWMQPLQVLYPKLIAKEAYQVLEYRGQAPGPVWVRYFTYAEGKEEPEALQSEVMEQIAPDVYAKAFLIFFGQRIHYEIYSLDGTEHRLLKQGVLQRGRQLALTGSKYSRLNHMLALREKRENLELYQELESYYGQNAVVEQLFSLK